MSDQINDVEDFIMAIVMRWPAPHTWPNDRKAAWGADLADQLGNEKPEVLRYALKLMIAGRSYNTTPPVADVMKVVNQAVRETVIRKQSEQLKFSSGPVEGEYVHGYWRSDRVRLAYELIKTEPARRAAQEGYIHGFWTYVIEYGKAPDDKAINSRIRGYSKDGKPIPGLKEVARQQKERMEMWAKDTSSLGRELYKTCTLLAARSMYLAEIAEGKNTPSFERYWRECFGPFERASGIRPEVQSTPASRYADVNKEEGRGWKGMTA